MKSKYPHIEWINLNNEGTLTECAVMKRDTLGNTFFIKLDSLDMIDKNRLFKIVTNRNAEVYELWDLMSNVTLGNGVNALTYFHQLAKVITSSGKIMNPSNSEIGIPTTRKDPASREAPVTAETAAEHAGTSEEAKSE
jgi:hypothetical protein